MHLCNNLAILTAAFRTSHCLVSCCFSFPFFIHYRLHASVFLFQPLVMPVLLRFHAKNPVIIQQSVLSLRLSSIHLVA